jgi:hypothetical protein
MSKTEETDRPSTFSHEIKGKVSKLKSSVGKRADDESSFHDSFVVTASMGYALAHEMLDAMGMSNTTFIDDLPDEAPSIELNQHFHDHTLKIKGGGKIIARFDNVQVFNFKITKESDTTHEIQFIVKGLPELSEHFNLERCILDSHHGMMFMLAFGETAQVELDLDETEGDAEEQEQIPSNVTRL